MKLRNVMRRDVVTVDTATTVGDAFGRMSKHGIRHVPVLHDTKLVGMLSERDVLHVRASADNGEWWHVPVGIAATRPARTAHPDDSLTEIAARFAQEKIGALVVVETGAIVGIVTPSDVLEAEVQQAMAPRRSGHVAADAMTASPLTVTPETSASDAIRLMLRHRIRHLPIVDGGGNLLGIVTDSDARDAAAQPTVFAHGREASQPTVATIAATKPVSTRFDTPLDELARRFADEHLDAVLVTDSLGAMTGILSYVDILRVLAR